ncbi:MAG: cobalamin-binding protein [Desulfatiglandaceae bacterium]
MIRRHLLTTGLMIANLLLFLGIHAEAGELTDQLGRHVTVPDTPKRVVSLAPSITEIVFALHREDCLVGVTQFSDFPPEANDLPSVGSYINLDLERIVALKPDLCLGTKDGNPKAVIQRLQALDIPVYVVDPKNLNAVMDTLLDIGKILNASPRAEATVASMRSRIKSVTSRVATTTHRPRVFFQIGITPIVSVGTPTFIHQLIVLAGGENVAQGPTAYPRFSREQVLALAPDVLIITSMARGERFKRVKTSWSKWSDLPAVRKHNVFVVESNLFDRASPRLVDALEHLARLIHPELFEEAP